MKAVLMCSLILSLHYSLTIAAVTALAWSEGNVTIYA